MLANYLAKPRCFSENFQNYTGYTVYFDSDDIRSSIFRRICGFCIHQTSRAVAEDTALLGKCAITVPQLCFTIAA